MKICGDLKLVILHNHYRPGGVRRVIELATPHLLRAFDGDITAVTLAGGEPPDRKWSDIFASALGETRLSYFVEPAFGYFSEQRRAPAALRRRVQQALRHLLADPDPEELLVWAHNPGLARNLVLTRDLVRACESCGIPLLAHHHDWWFDNRWQRWAEARRVGIRSLRAVAEILFGSPRIHHLAINQADVRVLRRRVGRRVSWLPNLAEPAPPPAPARVQFARAWLRHRLDHDAPVWLLPCRLLRRKNVAEALLLTRWLRPEAWLVTTGGVSSADELPYHHKLETAARAHHWRLRLGVLAGDETRKPTVAELLAASEAVLLTSIQEGFGLPYLEAAAARRPLFARALPNVAPDLKQFGFRFPQYYEEVLVSTQLFHWGAERVRQQRLFRAWLAEMPASARRLANPPPLTAARAVPPAVPFSRLTLTAQLEILVQPSAHTWEACAPLNPFLETWRRRAALGQLQISPWPRGAAGWLGGEAYGKKFHSAHTAALRSHPRLVDAAACQSDFIRQKLAPEFLYPLLWSRET